MTEALQKTRDEVEKALGTVFGKMHNATMSLQNLMTAKQGFISELRQLQHAGVLPAHIDVSPVSVTRSEEVKGQLDVGLPWFLRVYLQEGPTFELARFDHDCKKCIFLAHVEKKDLYYCKGKLPTLIARYGHDKHEYTSGMEFGRSGQIEELKFAFNLAREKGFIDDNGSPFD